MCLGVPARVIEVREGTVALVDFGGTVREVDATLEPHVKPGDYVIVHAGAIIAVLDADEAKKILETIEEYARLIGELV